MSGFKRNSRFSSGGGQMQQSSGNSGGSRFSGRSGGSSRSEGYSNGEKKFPFSRIGSLTVPKSVNDELANVIKQDLKGSEIKLNCKIYLPKETESLTLRSGDTLLVSFQTNENDKDFVIGHLLLKN